MLLAFRPSSRDIERFLIESRDLPLSYGPVGLVHKEQAGYDYDECVEPIGHGQADFERARSALTEWAQFNTGWVEVFPRAPGFAPGTVVAVLIRHLGFWSLNGARVVYEVGAPEEGTRFGFAYGTLASHAESGEELFEVSLQPGSGEVMYRIRAASRPRMPLARAGYPVVRMLQARFRRDSTTAMRRAVSTLRTSAESTGHQWSSR
jgi:uncharacterized protein (UPF0548 family)